MTIRFQFRFYLNCTISPHSCLAGWIQIVDNFHQIRLKFSPERIWKRIFKWKIYLKSTGPELDVTIYARMMSSVFENPFQSMKFEWNFWISVNDPVRLVHSFGLVTELCCSLLLLLLLLLTTDEWHSYNQYQTNIEIAFWISQQCIIY